MTAARGTARACVHHWRLEEADGPTSRGRCRRCGRRRTFSNITPEKRSWPGISQGKRGKNWNKAGKNGKKN